MENLKEARVNVAKKSQKGHFVMEAKDVVELNAQEESFNVILQEGKAAVLRSENHGDIVIDKNSTILHQDLFNPFSEMISKRLD